MGCVGSKAHPPTKTTAVAPSTSEMPRTTTTPQPTNQSQTRISVARPQSPAPEPVVSDSGEEWWYIDLSQTVQGPFSTIQMQSWFEGSLLPDNLMIRLATDPQGSFFPLSSRSTYLSAWAPGSLPYAEWQKKNAPVAAPPSTPAPTPAPSPPAAIPHPEHELPDAAAPSADAEPLHQDPSPISSTSQTPPEQPSSLAATSTPPPIVPRHTSAPHPSFPELGKTYAYVQFPYNAEREDELTIAYNQILEVLVHEPAPENWQMAKLLPSGPSGLIPGNYLKPLGDISSCPRATALNDWVPADEPKAGHCLRLKKDDIIFVVERHPTGWWTGVTNGRRGMFPHHFCTIE